MDMTTITNFQELRGFQERIADDGEKWVYRGEKYNGKEQDSLRTSLEMAFESIDPAILEEPLDDHKLNAEKDVIREFQRKLHLYSDNLPTRADILQWLSLMQHHGAPTRLMDWTYSFWVAVHFAVSRCKPGPDERVAIYAVNATRIANHGNEFKKKQGIEDLGDQFKNKQHLTYCDPDAITDNAVVHYLIREPTPMVYMSSSFRRNERLTIQQGSFLITGDVRKSFKDNLQKIAPLSDERYARMAMINVTPILKLEIIKKLREMNINNAVLFPGLDGFSQSLWARVSLPMKDKLLLETKDLTMYP